MKNAGLKTEDKKREFALGLYRAAQKNANMLDAIAMLEIQANDINS